MLKPREFQQLLIDNGFALPKYGADGLWGSESEEACEAWFSSGKDLMADPEEPSDDLVIPPEWLPDCNMSRIIVHWTAGAYNVSATDREHYHFIVGGNLVIVRGDYSIKANVSTSDTDGYAAHTKQLNTGSIGIAAACMANAVESPFNPGQYPLLRDQWEALAKMAAQLSRKYSIPVSPTTILQHGEVQKNLGVAQDGKWDIMKLPFAPEANGAQVGDYFRELVRGYL